MSTIALPSDNKPMTVARMPGSSELAITDGQSAFTAKQIAALKQVGVENASAADQAIFFHQCVRTGLDPFARQIYMIGRQVKNKKTQQWETKQTIQTGIDGYRLIAARTGDHAGTDDAVFGKDALTGDLTASVTVYKFARGKRAVFTASARWGAYVQTYKDKATGSLVPNSMWTQRGPEQLAKCAEALALRKAFPQDLSGIYTAEELLIEDAQTFEQVASPQPRPSRRATAALPEPPIEPEPTIDEFTPESTRNTETGELITPAQLKKLHVLLHENDLSDRDAGLAYMGGVIGRELDTSKDLTKAEASRVIERLVELDASKEPDQATLDAIAAGE